MSVILERKQEFIDVLDDYQPSQESVELLQNMPLVILLGVTASGRNTIINHLIATGRYHFVISNTTRPPKFRDGRMEQHGVNYYFRSEQEMLDDLRNGRMLEAELIHDQQVSGISIAELDRAHQSGKIPINEVDVGGTVSIRQAKPDTYFFFMIPPSFKEWMYRLQGREVMSQQELANRLGTARRIIDMALEDNFIFVVNESSHKTAEHIDQIVSSDNRLIDDRPARAVARQILSEIKTSDN